MRRGTASLLLHAGLVITSIVLVAWIVRRTALEPDRTADVAEAVLESPQLRAELSGQVAARISEQTGARAGEVAATVDQTIDQDGVATMLAGTISAAHRRLVDPDVPAPMIDTGTMAVLSAGLVPEQLSLDVPTIGVLQGARELTDRWLPLGIAVAAGLVLVGLVLHPNRPRALCHVGYWLVAATVVQVLVGYVIPVVLVPTVTSSPWADVVASVVRAYNGTLVTTLALVLAVGGAALLLGAAWGIGTQRHYRA